jgi:hypothetical protein
MVSYCGRSVQYRRFGINPAPRKRNKESKMLWALFMILQFTWLLGMAGGHTLGGFIHVLLVLAFITAAIKLDRDSREDVVTVDTKI